MCRISVIIPTLNEEHFLRQTITWLLLQADSPELLEILIIDAGSTDFTLKSVDDLNVITYQDPGLKGKKYSSLNMGISKASGEVLIFLDADTLVPHGFDSTVKEVLQRKLIGGAFGLRFKETNLRYRVLALCNAIRYHLDGIYLGDQSIFCWAWAAKKVNGYDHNLMESAYFCRKLRKLGKVKVLSKWVYTSARRFEEHGFWKVLGFDIKIWARFLMGLEVAHYGRAYWSQNG